MARNNRVESQVQGEGSGYQGLARLVPMHSQYREARRAVDSGSCHRLDPKELSLSGYGLCAVMTVTFCMP